MIRYLYSTDLPQYPELAAGMFRDRKAQFRDRLGWNVTVDALGWETDIYDALDPLYVIATDAAGGHAGSMRFLPTTGRHMLAEVFPHLADGPIRCRRIWEATRFCLAPGAGTDMARRLLLGASELGLGMGLTHALGVFDAPMVRVYRRLGWQPQVLGQADGIALGLWTFSAARHDRLAERCGVPSARSRAWFESAFGDLPGRPALPTRA